MEGPDAPEGSASPGGGAGAGSAEGGRGMLSDSIDQLVQLGVLSESQTDLPDHVSYSTDPRFQEAVTRRVTELSSNTKVMKTLGRAHGGSLEKVGEDVFVLACATELLQRHPHLSRDEAGSLGMCMLQLLEITAGVRGLTKDGA